MRYKRFRFREFPVYVTARHFIVSTKKLSSLRFPKVEQFALTSQLGRALDSIVLNIAEGADRGTDKDFAHFLNIANTSLNEVVACVDIALDCGYVSDTEHTKVLESANMLAGHLTAFRKSLLLRPTK
ncbi:MAG: four helix bundle protein [Minisyncoccia bacterium]